MEVISPVGRDFSLEKDADYSTLATACRCSSATNEYTKGSSSSTCSCGEPAYGTLYTNIYKG